MNKVLELEEVSRTFSSGVFRTHTVRAVDRVSFALERGKTFGLVGNSGCGKTTLSRMITRVLKPSGGRIRFEGEDIARLDRKGSRAYHRRVQIIFQNPEASLDPSMRIRDSLLEAMAIHRLGESREERMEKIRAALGQVGLPDYLLSRYPHQISGGEGQRLVICRALLLEPEVLLLDEPTSMLDVSVQASIMNLLLHHPRHRVAGVDQPHHRRHAEGAAGGGGEPGPGDGGPCPPLHQGVALLLHPLGGRRGDMRERVPMTDFARQWAEHVAASASPRMTDDQAERDFWHAFMTRKTYAPEPSALQVLERLRPLLRARGVETALEVGPGWGSYTMTLAELCREVACVDLSRDVLDFVLRAGAERGRDNITAFHAKWEAFTPERRYDLVFGYNCFYRQADLADCFRRMDRAADKLCVAGMNTGLAP